MQYAAGATVQILMFSILACKVKQNAPRCHIYLEIIYTRRRADPLGFHVLCSAYQRTFRKSASLGRSTVVTSLTGMNIYTTIFLTILGFCVYVVLGGLRAAFLYTLLNLHIFGG